MKMYKLIAGFITALFFGAIFTIAYTGNGSTCFSFLRYIPGGDKTGHVILMCILSIILTWISSFRSLKIRTYQIYYGTLTVFVFITAEEFLQRLSPYRTFDLLDLSCNYIGLVLASIILRLYTKRHPRADAAVKTPDESVQVQDTSSHP